MKKFLFTLAALLMMTSAFAQTDAKYLYVNTALTEQANADPEAWGLADGEMVFVISADIPAYMSAFEVWVDVPEGITYTMWECGADGAITYWNARHAQQTLTPTPTTSQAGPQHSLLAIQTEGYYQIDGVWTKVGAVKWAPGHYDEFMLLFATYTEDYHGGIINIDTAPSSGADPRGQTVNDLGDMGVHHVTPPTEPLPDPNAAQLQPCSAPVINTTMDDDNVYVTITWNESDGNKVYTGQETYPRPEYGQPDESYPVEAYTEASANYEESPHATATIEVPAKDPVWQDVAAPVITTDVQEDKVVVTIEWPTSTGNQVYTGEYEYARPEYGQPDESYNVEAYVEADYPYAESTHATATIEVPAKDPVWQEVAAPVITTTMDDNNVYVTIEWPTSTGNQVYTGEYEYARPEYGQPDESYPVEAYTEADYPYAESTHATATIDVPAKEQVVPVEDNIYVKFDGTELPVGKKIIFVYENGENSYAFGPIASGKGNPVNVVVENNEVNIANTDVIEFTVGGGDVAFGTDIKTYTLEYTDGYLAYNSSTNFKTLTSIGQYDSDAYWRLQSVTGGYALNNNASTNRYIRKHATSNKFGPYAVNNDSEIVVIYIEKSDEPVKIDPATPVINYETLDDKVVVTVTWNESDGNQVYTGEYEYARPAYGEPDESYNVEAYTEASETYNESAHATATIPVPAMDPQWVDGTAPVIEFIPTKDGNIVTEVEVVVTGADTYTIKVNGEALRGEKIAASYDEVKNIHVEAVKNANYPYMEATAEGNYTLNKLVAAPVITTEVYEDKVFVNITWPTTDGNNVYTGEYTYDRGEADQSFNVEAYTAAAGEYQESFHATATIEVPALEQTPDQTADPVITTTTGKYNEGYINITCADENAIIYYRYQLDDGEWTEWTEYEGPVMLVENGHYNIEAKAQDPEKEMSNVVEGELTVSDCTAVYEVTTGKAIANVRYFNLAGQEMQEANGMTIIVTTYTDGTTSAVKVMK